MAERVYKKRADLTAGQPLAVEGMTLPTAPQGVSEGAMQSVSATTGAQRVYKKRATVPDLQVGAGQTTQRTYTVRADVKARQLQTWLDDAMATVKATQDYATQNDGKYNREFGSEYTGQIDTLLQSADAVKSYVDLYKDDEKAYGELQTAVAEIQEYLRSFSTYAASVRESHSQYADELEYQAAVAAAQQDEQDRQVDTWELKNRIALTEGIVDMIAEYRRWDNHDPDTYYDPNGNGSAVVGGNRNSLYQQLAYYGHSPDDMSAEDVKNLEKQLHADKEAYKRATKAKAKAVAAQAKEDPAYAEYVARGAAMEKPTLSTYDKVAAAMTQEQKETYNYLLGKFSDGYTNEYGTDYADAYFELVRAGIQQDEAAAFHKKYLEGQWYEGVWSVVQGLDRTATGLQNAFGKLDTDDRVLDPQAVGALVTEDLGKKETPLWYNFAEGKWETKVLGKTASQMGYDLATTTAAMVPAIAAGALSNFVVPGAGAVVMPAVMGMSSGGSAYKEAIDRGYDQYDAQNYGMLVGTSEAALGYALNGVGVVGNSLSGNAIKSATSGIKNAALRGLVNVAGEMLSEAVEEGLQEILTPFFENIALDADNTWEDIDWEMAGYSAMMGAMSAGLMQGGGAVASVAVNAVRQNAAYRKLGKDILDGKNGVNIDKAIAIGLNNAKGTDAYNAAVKIQQKVNDRGKVSAYAVGRMVAESQTEQAQRARAIEAEVLESGAAVGYDAEAVDTVARAAVALNQRVRFAAEGELTNANNAGEYHRDSDTVLLNPVLTDTNLLIGKMMAHEMTHPAEGTKQLAALAKIAQRMENHKNDAGAWEKLKADIQREYAATGQPLDPNDPQAVEREAVAAWIGKNLFQNKAFAKAVADGDANVGNAFFAVIDRVRRAMGIKKDSAGNLAMLERLFMQALNARTIGPKEGDVQGAFMGYDPETGLPIYKSNFPKGTPKSAKSERILKLIQEVWSKESIPLVIKDKGKTPRKIEAQFDPTYYPSGEVTDASKLMGGNRHGSASEQRVTLDLADDYYQIASDAVYNYSKDEEGKTTETHRDVTQWHYFINDILFQEYGQKETTPYRVTINVKERSDGHFVYSFSAERQNKGLSTRRTLHADVTTAESGSNAQPNTNVAQNATDVNTQSMQEGAGVFTEDGGNSAQGALLPPEYRPGARAEGVAPNANVEGAEVTPSADGYTSSVTADAATPSPQGEGLVQVDEAAVLDTAMRSQVQNPVDVSNTRKTNRRGETHYDTGEALSQLETQLGTEELLRRMYNATQMDRPTGMVNVDGQRVDANAYMAAYEQSLPTDPAALEQHIQRLEQQRTNEVVQMQQEGKLEGYRFGGLKIDLQLFAAKRRWELLQLDAGENGTEVRQFYEKRLRGTDANHSDELVELLAGRSETYNPISNQETLDKANEALRKTKYQENLLRRIGSYNPKDLFNAQEVAAATVLINDAINDGEFDVAANLIIGLSRKGTEAGRAVQAFSMMARMTPEGTLKAAVRTLQSEADTVIGEGANEGLDVLADDIAKAIAEAEGKGISSEEIADRIRNGEVTLSDDGDTSSAASGPPSPQGEDYGTADEPLTTEQISKMQNLTPGKRVSFYDLTDEQVQAFAPLENRLYRELKNKSPFIRRRFGEWRVRDKTPVQIATKAGQKRGVQKNTDTGWNIQVSGKVFGENRGHFGSSSIAARPYLAYINDITRNAVLLDTSTLYEGKSPNSLCMHTLYALADIGDGPQLLKLYVEEMYDPNQKGVNRRAYELLNIESQPIGAKGSQQNAVSPVTLPTDTPTIADLIAIVKSKDASYKPKAPEDVLVDDLAATEGTYLTRDDVAKIVEKAVKDASNIPEQLKRYVLKKIRQDDGGLAQRIYEVYRKGDLSNVKLRRAMESALELPTLTDEDVKWIADKATEIQSLESEPVKQAAAMDELYDYLAAKMTVDGWDKLQSWRKFGMLFNVKTHLRNVLSNGAYFGIRKADDVVAMALERILLCDPSKRAAYLGWSHTEHGQNIMPTLEKQAELAVLEMQKRGAKYEQGTSQLKQRRKMFGTSKVGETLNAANRWNSEWLEREDIKFFRPAYIDALGQVMTARGVTEITPELHSIAMQRALEATFRADNVISDVIGTLKRFQGDSKMSKKLIGYAADVIIPFHKTPANIAAQAVWHSPVGIVKGAFDLCNALYGSGSKDAATAINTMAKGVTGTALLAIGYLLGQAGLFNIGFGQTEKERAADEMAGLQDGAFVICGVSVSLDWLQPVSSPLIVGASIGERMKDEGLSLSSVAGAVMDGTDSLFELTMLQSLYDVLGGYDAGASGTAMSVGENLVSQSVPTLVGQAARAIDPVQRKTKGDNEFMTIVNQVVAKIPGLTYLLDPELDVWGNEVYRTGKPGATAATVNAFQQVLLPANTKIGTGKDDPISQELLRLYNTLDTGAVIPTAITRDEAKEAGEDYVDVNKLLGGVNRLAVEELINNQKPCDLMVETGELTAKGNPKTKKVTKYYRDMTDDERRKALNNIYKNTKDGVIGEASEKTEEQLTDSEKYIRNLLRRVKNTAGATDPAPKQEDSTTSNTYYDDLLRRLRNGN